VGGGAGIETKLFLQAKSDLARFVMDFNSISAGVQQNTFCMVAKFASLEGFET
jgi:hypothetical protein